MLGRASSPYTIGFFTTGTDLEYSSLLARMVTKVAEKQNINLINFLGGSLNPNFTFSQYKYQYQCNVAFNFAHTHHIDGIILASGILASFLDSTDFYDFYSQFLSIPIVSLGVNINDLPSVYTDNVTIYNQLVSHLIQTHNRKRIAFISGPSSNTDAFDRYIGYTKALAENHIAYQADFVYIGDFTPPSAKDAIRVFIDEKHLDLDAIVCANDSMALCVISELKKRHIMIPEQIIVTGCDNIPSSAYCVPSLTSIGQSIETAATEAINLLIASIEGHEVSDRIIPSQIIYRESCGCHMVPYSSIMAALATTPSDTKALQLAESYLRRCITSLPQVVLKDIKPFVTACYQLVVSNTTSFLPPQELVDLFFIPIREDLDSVHVVLNSKNCMTSLKKDLLHLCSQPTTICYIDDIFCQISHELLNLLLDYYSGQNEQLNQHFSFIRQFLLTITHNISDKSQQLQSIIPSLMDSSISSCLIYLYPEGVKHNLSDKWVMPEDIYLYMGYINEQIIDPHTLPQKVDACDIATYGFESRDTQYTSCIHPIFFGNEQLGIVVFEMSSENYSLIDSLTVELGCALKLSSTFTAQRQTENKLETLSQTDELTGLLNRRGFFSIAQAKYLFTIADAKDGVFFYADMDALKAINDTYGHHEGDHAIIAMSKLLKETFNTHDIVGRIGGDEFVILCTDQDESYIDFIINKLNKLCLDYNASSLKPYTLSISIGGIAYNHQAKATLEYLLSKADKLLYDKKRLKKSELL